MSLSIRLTNGKNDGDKSLSQNRLVSIDQLRGYAIFGMILVNTLGMFEVIPWMLKHHRVGMSYADTIAPLFVFVVGIGFRMSATRSLAKEGATRTYLRMVKRYGIIIFLGLLYGRFDWQVDIWDALLDIGFAGLLCMPFIGRGIAVRLVAAIAFLAAYQTIYSLTGYGEWTFHNSINGGPLGPVAYSFVLLLGTLIVDVLALQKPRLIIIVAGTLSLVLSLLGWLLRFEWPGIKPEWFFSQYAMTAPYVLYSTGLAFLAFVCFYVFCDLLKLRVPQMTVLGQNPLVIYLLQAVILIILDSRVDGNASHTVALATFAGVYGTCYAVAWLLNWRGIIVKV